MTDSPEDDTLAAGLLHQAGVEAPSLTPSDAGADTGLVEDAWIEVIQKMDAVYADLVRHQLQLEEKNAALESAKQFIDSVLSSMTDVLIVSDSQGRIQEINSALQSLSGRSSADFIGHSLSHIFNDSGILDRLRQHSLQSEVNDCEVTIKDVNDHPIALAMSCSERLDQDGRRVGLVLIGRPIGELRRAYQELNTAHQELQRTQQQLVQSEKMASLGRLVAGVAHELNNPISFVYGNMFALQRYSQKLTLFLSDVQKGASTEALQDLFDDLKIHRIMQDLQPLVEGTLEGAERVSVIVQDLKRYSGGQKELPALFDLAGLVRKTVEWVARASRTKPTVNDQLPAELDVTASKGKIQQILVNLLQNAFDAMTHTSSPCLTLSCVLEADQLALQISDNGPGIPTEHFANIFDPFFTSKPVGQGTGLGLYISYGQAQELGGDLQATNNPAGGATFTLRIPKENLTGSHAPT